MTDRLQQYHFSEKYISELNTDVSMLSEKDQKVLNYSLNKEWCNPKFKMRWFVGETQITPFSKLRQWLLEIKGREEAIESLEHDIAKWQIEIDRNNYVAEVATDEFDKRAAALEAWNLERKQIATKRRLSNWYLERQQLIDLVNEFMESDEAYLPDGTGRTYMDVMDTEEEDVYEAEYWTNRLAKQAATDLLFYGRINSGNMDAILSMHPEQQTETLTLAINYGTQLKQTQEQLQSDVDSKLQIDKTESSEHSLPLPETPQTQPDGRSASDEDDLLNVYNS